MNDEKRAQPPAPATLSVTSDSFVPPGLSSLSLGVDHVIERGSYPRPPIVSADRRDVVYTTGMGEFGGVFVRDVATGERWGAELRNLSRPVAVARDGWLVVSSREDGFIRVYAPPKTLQPTPAETQAWLEGLSSATLDLPRLPEANCAE